MIRFTRVQSQLPAKYTYNSQEYNCRTLDVSLDGLKIYCEQELVLGETLDLMVTTEGIPVKMKVEIVNHDKESGAYGMFIKFISNIDRKNLNDYIISCFHRFNLSPIEEIQAA